MAQIIRAGPFVTDGERRTAAELERLPPDWVVICNKMLFTKGRDYELDFIVIADKFIFLLDEKSWRGKITGTDQEWILADGSARPNPLRKVRYEAKLLADHLRGVISELQRDQYFVYAGVILSSAKVIPQITDGSEIKEHIFLLSDVCQRLTELDGTHKGLVITQLRQHIRDRLYALPTRPETPARINELYAIEDAAGVRPGVRLLRARLVDSGEPRILMVYDVSKDPLPQEDPRLFYLREFKALQELRKTGYVPEVKDPFAWSDDFLVLPIMPPEGTSLPAYPFPVSDPELINELYLAAEAFKALGTIHRHNVLHRAINPEAIYLQQNRAPFGLMFTNFFAARAGMQSIAVSLDALQIEDPYIAPELSGGYGFARPGTDVFSLALVFLERWSGQPLEALRPKLNESVVLPDLQMRWPSLPPKGIVRLNELFRSIFRPRVSTPRLRSFDVAKHLEEIERTLSETSDPFIGRDFGNYKALSFLDSGSFGSVYKGQHKTLTEREVAIKVLHTLMLSTLEEQARFFQEAKMLEQLKHKHILSIWDVGVQDNVPYLVTIYAENGSLRKRLNSQPGEPLPLEEALRILTQIGQALDYAHQHNIIHRDLKPANILFNAQGDALLADFGFSKALTTASVEYSEPSGTPVYMAPEMLRGEVSKACDQYSLGCIAYELLTSYNPSNVPDFISMGSMDPTQFPIAPSQLNSQVPVNVEQAILKTMAKEPKDRYPDVATFITALQPHIPPPPRRWKAPLLIGIALLIILSSSFIFLALRSSTFTPTPAMVTATAQAYATASVIAANPYPYTGILAYIDPLKDNLKGLNWDQWTDSNNGCEFMGRSYQINGSPHLSNTRCYAHVPQVINFVSQVTMTILKGDCGGLIFRGNSNANKGTGYFFKICQDGYYELSVFTPNHPNPSILVSGKTSPMKQTNIAVEANGSSINLYVNNDNVPIKSATDTVFNQGQIGLFAYDYHSPETEVAFTNLKVWKLP